MVQLRKIVKTTNRILQSRVAVKGLKQNPQKLRENVVRTARPGSTLPPWMPSARLYPPMPIALSDVSPADNAVFKPETLDAQRAQALEVLRRPAIAYPAQSPAAIQAQARERGVAALKPKIHRRPQYVQTPPPIVYPEDEIRDTFYETHPYELLRPRYVVESEANLAGRTQVAIDKAERAAYTPLSASWPTTSVPKKTHTPAAATGTAADVDATAAAAADAAAVADADTDSLLDLDAISSKTLPHMSPISAENMVRHVQYLMDTQQLSRSDAYAQALTAFYARRAAEEDYEDKKQALVLEERLAARKQTAAAAPTSPTPMRNRFDNLGVHASLSEAAQPQDDVHDVFQRVQNQVTFSQPILAHFGAPALTATAEPLMALSNDKQSWTDRFLQWEQQALQSSAAFNIERISSIAAAQRVNERLQSSLK
ncbi:hypothetical protein CXG81DRAFT_23338 [Caulochytrium protostelioides]|uniref:Small ribosomal subunit protein mS23 n=1 Tax=Caulochytrium protostelioides TaxID=1555241 RepID=A0A4P9XFR5_9FUNG|nr:hypothetical protein CXG81DRAFT_23338 [Caulochytrium protostelioides]|eukprot:RKP04081.1 hypothetical protein CXG81DRAFT_23338 [Caulochytrium protostelioides]